jgi:hypothetical protein
MRCTLNIRFSIPSTHLVVYATFYTKGKNWEDEYKMRPRRLKGSRYLARFSLKSSISGNPETPISPL